MIGYWRCFLDKRGECLIVGCSKSPCFFCLFGLIDFARLRKVTASGGASSPLVSTMTGGWCGEWGGRDRSTSTRRRGDERGDDRGDSEAVFCRFGVFWGLIERDRRLTGVSFCTVTGPAEAPDAADATGPGEAPDATGTLATINGSSLSLLVSEITVPPKRLGVKVAWCRGASKVTTDGCLFNPPTAGFWMVAPSIDGLTTSGTGENWRGGFRADKVLCLTGVFLTVVGICSDTLWRSPTDVVRLANGTAVVVPIPTIIDTDSTSRFMASVLWLTLLAMLSRSVKREW